VVTKRESPYLCQESNPDHPAYCYSHFSVWIPIHNAHYIECRTTSLQYAFPESTSVRVILILSSHLRNSATSKLTYFHWIFQPKYLGPLVCTTCPADSKRLMM
jgi:hypothetical protein